MDKLLTVFSEKDINEWKKVMESVMETYVPGSEIKYYELNGYLAETEDGEVYENIHINIDLKILGKNLESFISR